jgi:hypothetical protein
MFVFSSSTETSQVAGPGAFLDTLLPKLLKFWSLGGESTWLLYINGYLRRYLRHHLLPLGGVPHFPITVRDGHRNDRGSYGLPVLRVANCGG